MIPRTIHYCWFGGKPMPKRVKLCIESWKRNCSDYEIVRWDESNFDVNYNQFTQDAYKAGKWAFVSDVARLYVIYHHGGIYLDTDVELLKSLDQFLSHRAFMGMENNKMVATGLGYGAIKELDVIGELLAEYDRVQFDASNPLDCPKLTTEFLKRYGYSGKQHVQTVRNIVIYPPEYFAPLNWETGKLLITPETVSIHYYLALWKTKKWKQKKRIRQVFCSVLGEERGLQVYSQCSNLLKKSIGRTTTTKDKDE